MIILVCEVISSVWLCIVYQSLLIQVCVKNRKIYKNKKPPHLCILLYQFFFFRYVYGRDTLFH